MKGNEFMKENGLVIDKSLTSDIKLYRYMTLSKFIAMVENGEMCLTLIKEWEDVWEYPNMQYNDVNSNNERADLFGQSWSLEGISDALWEIYSKDREGILIQTTIEKFKLLNGFKFGILSPVFYYDNMEEAKRAVEAVEPKEKVFAPGLLKRKAYKHEKEVRLLTLNYENPQRDVKHIKFSLDLIDFIENIIIDSKASNWYVDTIKKYCCKAGFRKIPTKSDLLSCRN